MIEKGKNLQFYIWSKDNQEITVVGSRLPEKPLTFSFFIGKDQIEDTDGSFVSQFVVELKESMTKQKSKQAISSKKPTRVRRPRKRR